MTATSQSYISSNNLSQNNYNVLIAGQRERQLHPDRCGQPGPLRPQPVRRQRKRQLHPDRRGQPGPLGTQLLRRHHGGRQQHHSSFFVRGGINACPFWVPIKMGCPEEDGQLRLQVQVPRQGGRQPLLHLRLRRQNPSKKSNSMHISNCLYSSSQGQKVFHRRH